MNEMKQCLLCNSYIEEIKQMSQTIKTKGIQLNEKQKECNRMEEEKRGLQRQVDAFKELLASKGIMLNEGEEKDFKYIDEDHILLDSYDYAADDMNFDAARERRENKLR